MYIHMFLELFEPAKGYQAEGASKLLTFEFEWYYVIFYRDIYISIVFIL